MSYGRSKNDNAYAQELINVDAPKTVFMAIALSFATRLTDGNIELAKDLVWTEWEALYVNRVVPQKPRRG